MPERPRRDPHNFVTRSETMRALADHVRRLAGSAVPVLIEGESGVGKELIARALHDWSPRAPRRFVVGNCAAIPDTLAEAELFGYVAGAFTGALRERRGMFESADGGTMFLDELGEMTAGVQAKVLRVLEDGEYRRLGESDARRASVRVVAATNRDLDREVREGRFREDLFYRLAVVRVRVPPLRERRDEIPELARHFLASAAGRSGRRPPRLDGDAVAALCAHRWPGNVRELRNEMERLVALHGEKDVVGRAELSERVRAGVGGGEHGGGVAGDEHSAGGATAARPAGDGRLHVRMEEIERSLICEALDRYSWNKSRAARELGVTRQGLAKKMTRFGIPARKGDARSEEAPAGGPLALPLDEPLPAAGGSSAAARS
jgi:two-component system response regulator HupR/HoxA